MTPVDATELPAPPALEELISRQIALVADRTQGSAEYASERAEVVAAANELRALVGQPTIGTFVGSLTPETAKPQFLVQVVRGDEQRVLKVYGRQRPAEAAVLRCWGASGIPVAEVIVSGDAPVSWLLMRKHDGAEPTIGSRDAIVALTAELASITAVAHAVEVPGDVGKPLDQAIARHLDAVTAFLVDPYAMARDLLGAAKRAFADGGRTCLHGDLTPKNLLGDLHTGGLRLLDPCGYRGDASFDAARWCARMGLAEGEECLQTWLEHERLDPRVLRRMYGAELLMEAGVREIRKVEAAAPRDRDHRTEALVAAAAEALLR